MSTALQRCDREIRKAHKHLSELKDYQSLYVLNPDSEESTTLKAKFQQIQKDIESKIKEEIMTTEDYLKRMREWRRNSLSKLQRWAKEKEDMIGNDVVHGK